MSVAICDLPRILLLQVKKRDDKDAVTGIAFVKYSKASEAAKAIEELNGKVSLRFANFEGVRDFPSTVFAVAMKT